MADPRPLTTEPLPLDLLNTVWMSDGAPRDLLDEDGGMRVWLDAHALTDAPADVRARNALVEAREAMRGFLATPDARSARRRLDAVLVRGAARPRLAKGGAIGEEIDVAPSWRVPWQAAVELLRLREEHGDRIRRCANHDCVLWFLDVSRPGTRRWCSMASCGNREKARRHYAPTV